VNNPTRGEFCFTKKRKANIKGEMASVQWRGSGRVKTRVMIRERIRVRML